MAAKRGGRVCVVGLDGVPVGLLSRLAQSGVMPNMARLIGQGHLHQMKASLPEISSVSWTSFMTGANPGQHGVFGFTDLQDRSYRVRFPNYNDVKIPTIWDRLAERGRKSIVINQPSTYPARKIEGALVSGFVAIELARAVHPLTHLAALEKMGYRIDVDMQKGRAEKAALWRELDETLDSGRRAFDYFWPQEWDYFEFVVTGTDRLHHILYPAGEDESHPAHGMFRDYYRKVDQLVGDVANRFGEANGGLDGLFMLSDHGFTTIEQEVHLNTWLEQAGFLKFDSPEPEKLVDIGPGTRAFALDPNRIYLNLKGKYPRGVVAPADKKSLKQEIAAAVRELRCDGKPVVREVFDCEEIYTGPLIPKGPDLVVLAHNGFDMKGAVGKKELFVRTDLVGMHTWDDAFFWSMRDHGSELTIYDLAPILLEGVA
ncbi:MAG: alkaline phosphatase family protein [Acidobacteria bacterium]|nr:alkaline phosphatase family protein [Acidobacteriota bacterium]